MIAKLLTVSIYICMLQVARAQGVTESTDGQPSPDNDDETCISNSDCTMYPYEECGIEMPERCGHKNVFPQTNTEIAGLATFSFIMALCVVAGLGGGGIAVSILIGFFKFTTKPAVAISTFSILIGAIMRFFYSWKAQNPKKPGMNVIDYSLACVMSPTTLAGSQVGSIILKTFPSFVIQILLTLLLGFLGIQSARKGYQLHKQEVWLKKIEDEANKQTDETPVEKVDTDRAGSRLRNEETDTKADSSPAKTGIQSEEIEEENAGIGEQIVIAQKTFTLGRDAETDIELKKLSSLVKTERGHCQMKKQGVVWFMIVCILLMNLMLGSSQFDSIVGIKECTFQYWAVQFVFVLICTGMTVLAIIINRQEQDLKKKYEVNFVQGDVEFHGKSMVSLILIGFFGGLVAGAFGLGGGSIYNPAFLTLGVNPRTSGATGMFLVMLSTINTGCVNYLNGYLNVKYACWVSVWSLAGSIVGMMLTDKVIKMTGKASIIVWVLVFVFFISTIATPIFGGISLYQETQQGKDIFVFQTICN